MFSSKKKESVCSAVPSDQLTVNSGLLVMLAVFPSRPVQRIVQGGEHRRAQIDHLGRGRQLTGGRGFECEIRGSGRAGQKQKEQVHGSSSFRSR